MWRDGVSLAEIGNSALGWSTGCPDPLPAASVSAATQGFEFQCAAKPSDLPQSCRKVAPGMGALKSWAHFYKLPTTVNNPHH